MIRATELSTSSLQHLKPSLSLRFVHGRCEGQTIPIPENSDFTIGRSRRCDLRIISSAVSRMHCRLELENGVLHVEDLHSLTGTFLNEQVVSHRVPVQPGDELRVGPFRLQVVGKPDVIASRKSPVAKRRLSACTSNTSDGYQRCRSGKWGKDARSLEVLEEE